MLLKSFIAWFSVIKKIFILLIIVFISTTTSAQYMLEKGDTQINGGLGFVKFGNSYYVGFDYGVHKDFSVGGAINYRSYTNQSFFHDHFSILGISANTNYHFNNDLSIPINWDFYAGGNIGFYAWSYPENYATRKVSPLGLGFQIGGRYYIKNNFGLNIELGAGYGGGKTFDGGKFGISYKF